MTAIVTLHIFSGRPNPTWQLTSEQDEMFNDRLQSLNEVTYQRPSGVVGKLGYRGFSVTRGHESSQGPMRLYIHERIVDQSFGLANLVDNTNVEMWLVEIAGRELDNDLRNYVISNIREREQSPPLTSLAIRPTGCPQNNAADAPVYNPGIWNTPTVQPYNNCYNYANNNATNTFAQPGRATGHPATVMACSHVTPAAQSDGLRPVPNFGGTLGAGAGWYVALVVWPNRDYHWYRQDNVGCWSHKPGQTAARNTDNSGRAISDPQTCDRGPYTNFCTYMVTDRHVHIR